MDFFQHRYYRTTRILMTIIGQWPNQSPRARRGYLAGVILFGSGGALPLIMATVKYHEDRNILLDGLAAIVFGLWCFVKFVSILWNSKKVVMLLNRIRADWHVWVEDQEVNILHEYAERGRKFVLLYTITMYFLAIVYMTQPIVPKIIDIVLNNGTKPGQFPNPLYYYHLDQQKYYYYIFIKNSVCNAAVLTISLAYDVMLIVYVQHGCGIFAALGHKLEGIGKNKASVKINDKAYDSEERSKTFERLIFSCIARHNDAIEYANLIETTFSWTFFITLVFRLAIISMTGLQIVSRMNEPHESARFIGFAVGLLAYVYMESYISQILMDHSTSIRDYIHNGQWYNLPARAQKLLQFMTMRCNAPCQLTAGKMIRISVESFAGFLKTAMSYLTVLRSI